jgi:hypothetical protein
MSFTTGDDPHIPTAFVVKDSSNSGKHRFWFSRSELLMKKHMKPNFQTFRNEEPKG